MDRKFKQLIFLFVFLFGFLTFLPPVCFAANYTPKEEDYCAYAHFLTAELQKLEGNVEEVIQEYEKAIECDPSSFYLRKELLILLLSQSKVDSAKSLIEQTIKLFPDESDLALILAQLYRNEGKNRKAARILNKVVKKEPENRSANLLLFAVFLDDKNWKEAKEYADKLVELAKEESAEILEKTYIQIGVEYAKVGKFSEGLDYLMEARALSPDNPQIYLALGTLYESEGKPEEALKEYERAMSLSPFSVLIYYKLGEIYNQLGRVDEAVSIYEKALQLNSSDYVSSTNLAQLYYAKKEYLKGLKILQDCPIKDSRIYYLLGIFLTQLDRISEAEESLKKSIELTPASYIPYSFLVHIYGKEDKKEEALSLLNDAEEKSLLAEGKLYLLFGVTYANFKEYGKSVDYLKKAYDLSPDDDTIIFQLAASYERSNDWFRAVYYLRKAIKLNPKNAEALNYLGYMFAEKGIRLNESIALIEKALEIVPENGYFVDSLGWAYYQKGLWDKALGELEKAVRLLKEDGEDDAIVREHLGDVYYKKGNIAEARKQWEISLSLDSTRKEVKEKLERLEK